jgi:hypothetical protein
VKPSKHIPFADDLTPPGPFDRTEVEEPWFLPPQEEGDARNLLAPLPRADRGSLLDAAGWRAAEAALSVDLADLTFDLGRLVERVAFFGQGAVQRLALAEASSMSWWSGDRVTADQLALWLSYRIGAAEEGGEGLIRTAWAARRLAAPVTGQGRGQAEGLTASLGDEGRADADLLADVATEMGALEGVNAVTRGAALCQLWRALDERPDHLRGLEAAVLGARLAGKGALPFLPLTLTGFSGLTASASPEARLAGWISGAHRAVLSALMMLERLSAWRTRAEAETADLQGRTPAKLIAALAAHPMLASPQAETETGASRAAVQRNLDVLAARCLVREVTGQGRFRVWAAKV